MLSARRDLSLSVRVSDGWMNEWVKSPTHTPLNPRFGAQPRLFLQDQLLQRTRGTKEQACSQACSQMACVPCDC